VNLVAANLSPEQISELEQKFGFTYRPSASQPNEEPTSRRQAKGRSLPKSESISVPGTTSAQRTRANNPNKDRSGHRQVSNYSANKIANQSLTTKKQPQKITQPISKSELKERLLNPNNRHYQGNPVIDRNTHRPYQ
jgi:hypothetical protein